MSDGGGVMNGERTNPSPCDGIAYGTRHSSLRLHRSIVVIGYGNELRGDDAIGPIVARTVDAWQTPGVRGIALHQLTPEVAATLADADVAVFVDASVDGPGVSVQSLAPADPGSASAHAADPARLLGLTQTVYGKCPPAWYITVGAHDMSLGERLTPAAEAGVAEALERIEALLRERGEEPCTKSA